MISVRNRIEKMLSEDCCDYGSSMYVGVKSCTNGFKTKTQTLAHNVLITGLDGDPLWGYIS